MDKPSGFTATVTFKNDSRILIQDKISASVEFGNNDTLEFAPYILMIGPEELRGTKIIIDGENVIPVYKESVLRNEDNDIDVNSIIQDALDAVFPCKDED